MKYKAFGFVIDSEFEIPQAIEVESDRIDIRIISSDLSHINIYGNYQGTFGPTESTFHIEDIGLFRITNGNCIEVDLFNESNLNELSVYLMGSCMGAIIHQRDLFPLHGSCVTNGFQSILITGDSHAGKSTLAAEFLSHGWKILTDDVCIVKEIDKVPMAQSSYPSQKLWKDSRDAYGKEEHSISLYTEGDNEKFGIQVQNQFYDGMAPLSLMIRLAPQEDMSTDLYPIERIPAIEQVRYNTYRSYMIDKSRFNAYFQKCVTLSGKVPMALAIRKVNEKSAELLYEKIIKHLEDMK